MPTLLSTKTLTIPQRELLLNTGLGFVEHDFIQTKPLLFSKPKNLENLIFTSQNAVHYFFEKIKNHELVNTNAFCVGTKTKIAIEQKGLKVVEMTQTAAILAHTLVEKYKNVSFLFICGKKRRNELPLILKENEVSIEELVIYDTLESPITITRLFDGILFFSPSAVQSYSRINKIGTQHCFCIGTTTANTIDKPAIQVTVANKSTIENVIVQAVKFFK